MYENKQTELIICSLMWYEYAAITVLKIITFTEQKKKSNTKEQFKYLFGFDV